MNSSERIVQDRQAQQIRDSNDEIRNRPIGGGGGGPAPEPVGMGNLSGWAVAAGMIGAVLGGIGGQGLAGAIFGGLFFGGGLWAVSFVARKSGAWDRDARPLVWLMWGAALGAVVGALFSILGREPFLYSVQTWAIFLGGLAGLFCWICRFAARREQ